MKIEDRILVIVDLLMAGVYCDGTMVGEESTKVRNLVADLLLTTGDALPDHVNDRIANFRIYEFDLETAVSAFLEDPPMKRRRLLELVVKMTGTTGVLDITEDDFVRDLATALSMPKEEYQDLVLDYSIEDMRRNFREISSASINIGSLPPPIPDDAI